ncbi:Phospholipase d protein 1, putative [Brugia malayi]|uniref:Phospholipase n=3 Tax=Brugia TaxID=6278 RepID=A0A4E9FGV1_BRUMA|nr:Phospholipase d protein 1, putative [Brugia malayi]VIO94868.1 Phospholipase d protein 1, putative [Brugia malayi]
MADGSDHEDFDGFACDCIVSQLYEALPGSPSYKIGIVPYLSTYDTQDQARHRGYWIPGVPVKARITDVKRDEKFGLHLINAYLYVIELEHGPFRWTVVKQNKDFAVLAARLLTHRAAERIRAPVRRAQEVLDDALESIGVDIIPDHRNDCPYRKTSDHQKIHNLNRSDDRDNIHQSGTTKNEINTEQQSVPTDFTRTASVRIPNVSPLTRENILKQRNVRLSEIKRHQLPSLGFVPDAVIDPNERRQRLEKWLQAVLHIPVNRNHHETAEFLEVSRFSFITELGGKYCEGFVKKRPGGGRVFIGWKQCCVRYCLRWSKRWLILKDSSVCYMNPRTEQIRFVLLFDRDFDVSAGINETVGMPDGLVISNQQHILALKCRTPLDAIQWKAAILESMNSVGRIWLENHPYGSTFPVRRAQSVQWFVDGRSFMEHAANMMELAREEIFIAGWWLSPEIFMKRPPVEGNRWRLDEILKRKAEQGVRIFVLLYKEMEMALGINSIYTKRTLQTLHKNIKVLRHPDHYLSSGTFFWAHHEKLIVIDQLIAFVGGVDLCFGRWDDCRHKLADCGSVKISEQQNICLGGDFSMVKSVRQIVTAAGILSPIGLEENEEVTKKSVGYDEIDRSNDLIDEETEKIKKTKTKNVQRCSTNFARRKQHKKSQHNEGDHEAPRKLTEHNHVLLSVVKHTQTVIRRSKSTAETPPIEMLNMNAERMDIHDAMDKYKAYVHSGKAEEAKHNAEKKSTPPPQRKILSKVAHSLKPSSAKKNWQKVKQETTRYDFRYMELRDQNEKIRAMEERMTGAGKLWVGKDYANFIHKDFVELDMPFHDFIDRNVTPRMPWHDIHACTYGSAARDIARHFIQRWNATKTEKSKELKEYPFLLPKCYDTIKVPRVLETYSSLADVQILRSVSKWSSLTNCTEDSIQQAYLSLIANAQHYIYIENQFFISIIDSDDVRNEICKVLCERIKRAYRERAKFRVYIMLPLLPGFEGDIGAPGGSALQAVLHWTYKSLSRGPDSLIESLKRFVPDPMEYIHIGSLRTYEILSGKLLTELIYIHCKLMIVDDRYVIIGSANINDRSQVGNRDSEVCILVKDYENVSSRMDGKPYDAGKFAFSLRKTLMMEHLGLLPEQKRKPPKRKIDVDDPVTDSFFVGTWGAIAKKNTEIFEKVFNVIPTDKLKDFVEVQMHVAKIPLSETVPQVAEEYLRDLIGNLVEFPLNFLANANLAPGFTSKEGIVPSSVFT